MTTFGDLEVGDKFKIQQSGLNWRPEIIEATWTKIKEISSISGRYNCTSNSPVFPDTWLASCEEVSILPTPEQAASAESEKIRTIGVSFFQ